MAAFVLWEGDGNSEKVNVDPEILQRVAAEFYSRASKRKGEGSVQIKEDCEVFAAGVAAGLARDALKTSE